MAFFRRANWPRSVRYSGFTLIEVLVVLLIMGMMAGVVAPAINRMLDGANARLELQQIIQACKRMPYRVQQSAQYVDWNVSALTLAYVDGSPLIDLPEGWQLLDAKGKGVSPSGFCMGGDLKLKRSDGEIMTIRILKGACEPKLV
ncbi:type II secretion system GspH family protein [Burkholderiaceae bacterium DAT-1]|nr:type II secretion system GspH family protein [Burkholderiaceae bacterium DAT-1]